MAKKILVIDDDLFIRELYTEILQKAGYEVDAAIDGEDGLVKIQKNTYSVILLDMIMPKLDGIGVLSALQSDPPAAGNGPIILLINSGDDKQVADGIKKGARTYLVKAAMTPDQLVENINKSVNP